MRRRLLLFGLCALVLGLGVLLGSAGSAADATPVAPTVHPLVGAWAVTDPQEYTDGPEFLITFFEDGNALLTDAYGRTRPGVWEPHDGRSGRWAVVQLAQPGTTDLGSTFFGNAFVDESGDRFISATSEYYPDERKMRGERITTGELEE